MGIENIKLPSESSNRRMVLESNLIAKMQIAERMLESQNPITLHFDGTTDAQKHYLGFQVSTSDGSLSLSMSENLCGDTKTQLDTAKEIFSELSDLISNSDDEIEKNYAHLLISIKNLMSDQHIVNKNFYDEFVKLRTDLLEKFDSNWNTMSEIEKQKSSEIHQWFCHLHVLSNLGERVNKALKEYEHILTGGNGKLGRNNLKTFQGWSDNDSSAVRCIRTVCSAFVSGGNAAAGCPEDFKSYLCSKNKTCKLKNLNTTDLILYLKTQGLLFIIEMILLIFCLNIHL